MAFDINKMKENQKIHETTVVGDLTVKAYLPYMEKIEFAADV